MRIRKGDQSRCCPGKNRGKTGEVIRAMPAENKVIVAGREHRQAPHPADAGHDAGRHHRQGHAAAGLSGRDHLLQGRPDPDRLRDRRRRQEASASARSAGRRCEPDRRPPSARGFDGATTSEIRAAAAGELGLANVMEVPRLEKIVINMRRRPCHPAAVAARRRGPRPRDDHRPEARSSPRPASRSPASSSARATRSARW